MAERYPLLINGTERGSLRVREEGLRTVFEAECPDDGAGIYRAAAVGPGGRLNLGAMAPEKGRLMVRRSFSRDEMGRAGVSQITSGEAFLSVPFSERRSEKNPVPPPPQPPQEKPAGSGWQPVRNPERFLKDPILAAAAAGAQGALTKTEEGYRLLAFPFQTARPFPLMPAFCFARIAGIDGKSYAVYKFNPEGLPVL
ncbi:hypothetical protein [Papillibacter cinnamivorans]|uniref:Uncharacterized protein n=1 Tax=Papillibacter cinnamivorans DSM 12816 TaxID=1122930 RepID=A0A1W1ZAT6_9FIRM|nr:hypothetical protein [Papillibacter cinnamivorans]SMC45550.1 hypothetical protein SAMN02745168_0925 [Papillibacter cinnamivorans DSM 12816]